MTVHQSRNVYVYKTIALYVIVAFLEYIKQYIEIVKESLIKIHFNDG
jgi:hypothetical protein